MNRSTKKDACVQFGVDESLKGEKEIIMDQTEWKFLSPGAFSDVKLIVGDKTFYSHKIMLANYSPVFMAMLSGNFKEKNQSEITIRDVDPLAMELTLQSLYSPSYKCEREKEAYLILPVVDRYQIEYLIRECENVLTNRCIQDSPSASNEHRSVIDYFRLANKYMLSKLKQASIDTFGRVWKKDLLLELRKDPEMKDFENEVLRCRVKTLEDQLKNIELCLSMPCSRVERRETREPVNHCTRHNLPLSQNEETGSYCEDCVKKLKQHIKNVCTTDKIRTTINYSNSQSSGSSSSNLNSSAAQSTNQGQASTSNNTTNQGQTPPQNENDATNQNEGNGSSTTTLTNTDESGGITPTENTVLNAAIRPAGSNRELSVSTTPASSTRTNSSAVLVTSSTFSSEVHRNTSAASSPSSNSSVSSSITPQ